MNFLKTIVIIPLWILAALLWFGAISSIGEYLVPSFLSLLFIVAALFLTGIALSATILLFKSKGLISQEKI